MKWGGNVRKMGSSVDEHGRVSYLWRGADILNPMEVMPAGDWVGQHVKLEFDGDIHFFLAAPKSMLLRNSMDFSTFFCNFFRLK